MIIFKTIFKTLNKNASSFTITDEAISNNSIFEVYPSDDSIILADVTVNGTTANITFDSAAEYNIPCAVFINNLVGAYEGGLPDVPYDTRFLKSGNNNAYWGQITANDVYYNNGHLDDTLDNVTGTLDHIATELFNETVAGGVFYHSISGNNIWKKLDASNIDYDSDSTIYSAMGNVDELETESNNLVDAINEVNSKPTSGLVITNTPTIIGKFKDSDLWCVLIEGNITGGTQNIIHNISNINEVIDYNIGRISPDGAMYVEGYGEGTSSNYNFTALYCNRTSFAFRCNGWNTGKYRAIIMYTISE